MKQTVWLGVILLVTLVGCVPGSQPETPTQETRPAEDTDSKPQQEIPNRGLRPDIRFDPDMLTSPVSGEQLIRPEEGNCPVNETDIEGQGAHAVGSIGGLAIPPNPTDKNGVSIPSSNPLETGEQMFAIAAPNRDRPTAIIIVDDFNGNLNFERREDDIHTRLGLSGVYFLDQQRDQPTLAGLMSGASETEVTALENAGQYSHGALVFNHTLALLSAEDHNPELSVIPVSVPDKRVPINIPIFTFTKLNIVVAALDTENFNTEIIGGRLQATIQTLAQGQMLAREQILAQQVRRFAVNLSFGLVPCSVLADIEAGIANQPGLTFEEYQKEVFDENKDNPGVDEAQLKKDLVNILTTPIGGDSLLADAATDPRRLAGATDITYLAASGNYRLPYSLYPGYWPEFVSVSAQNLANTSSPAVLDPDYSDTGEVLLPGGYFTLTAYDPETKSWRSYPQISIAGTSFSAPVLSVFAALDFTGATPRCARKSPSITSPLAFFKTNPPVALPTPELNLALKDALNRYCP